MDGTFPVASAPPYEMHGYVFRPEDLEIFLYFGFTEADVDIISSIGNPSAQAEPGFLVDPYGIRTRATSLWPEARALEGLKIGHPFPANFHWEAIEWIALHKAVRDATGTLRILELGAGWGPCVVSGGVLGRLRGITDIHLTAVEADPHHARYLRQHMADNGFAPKSYTLFEAAVGPEAGAAQWPDLDDTSSHYGFRPIEADGEYMARTFEKTRQVDILAATDVLRTQDRWDFVHMDIQGGETEVCRAAFDDLNARVKRVLIGTHSRKIEGDLMEMFAAAGWILEHEKPTRFTFWQNPSTLEAMTTADGVQVWRNPNLN
jgi:FkbM family methyltransferase